MSLENVRKVNWETASHFLVSLMRIDVRVVNCGSYSLKFLWPTTNGSTYVFASKSSFRVFYRGSFA